MSQIGSDAGDVEAGEPNRRVVLDVDTGIGKRTEDVRGPVRSESDRTRRLLDVECGDSQAELVVVRRDTVEGDVAGRVEDLDAEGAAVVDRHRVVEGDVGGVVDDPD